MRTLRRTDQIWKRDRKREDMQIPFRHLFPEGYGGAGLFFSLQFPENPAIISAPAISPVFFRIWDKLSWTMCGSLSPGTCTASVMIQNFQGQQPGCQLYIEIDNGCYAGKDKTSPAI